MSGPVARTHRPQCAVRRHTGHADAAGTGPVARSVPRFAAARTELRRNPLRRESALAAQYALGLPAPLPYRQAGSVLAPAGGGSSESSSSHRRALASALRAVRFLVRLGSTVVPSSATLRWEPGSCRSLIMPPGRVRQPRARVRGGPGDTLRSDQRSQPWFWCPRRPRPSGGRPSGDRGSQLDAVERGGFLALVWRSPLRFCS